MKLNMAVAFAVLFPECASLSSIPRKGVGGGKSSEIAAMMGDGRVAELMQGTEDVQGDTAMPARFQSPENFRRFVLQVSHATDKVTSHSYQFMYQKYLSQLVARKLREFEKAGKKEPSTLRLLEIGLGCGMDRGPGGGWRIWTSLLDGLQGQVKLDLHIFEFNEDCGRKWAASNADQLRDPPTTLHYGDQGNASDLDRATAGHTFDVIIDDGSNLNSHQRFSLLHLFPSALAPGGVYFIEDLQSACHSWRVNSGSQEAHQRTGADEVRGTPGCLRTADGEPTMMATIIGWQMDIGGRGAESISELPSLKHIDQFRQAAVFEKELALQEHVPAPDTSSWQYHLKGVNAADRDLTGIVSMDLSYQVHVSPRAWLGAPMHTYASVMKALHGGNVWLDPKLQESSRWSGANDGFIFGSPLNQQALEHAIATRKPRVSLEVGTYRGATSTQIAKLLDALPGCEDSFVISMDTWLLDLRFQWSGQLSTHKRETTGSTKTRYFHEAEAAGISLMYWTFLQNVVATNTTHRIIPMPTASANGALALIAHQIRPEMIYLDASHANPDVFIDLENFYAVLAPGGILFADDYGRVPTVRDAVDSFCARHGLSYKSLEGTAQISIEKPLE